MQNRKPEQKPLYVWEAQMWGACSLGTLGPSDTRIKEVIHLTDLGMSLICHLFWSRSNQGQKLDVTEPTRLSNISVCN